MGTDDVFVWSRGRQGGATDAVIVEDTEEMRTVSECIQSHLGMEHGKRYRLIAEEAPLPKPEPKGEMVERMLIGYGDDWRDNSSTNLLDKRPYGILGPKRTFIGTYLVPNSQQFTQMTLKTILAAIRDAGGTCLAGEPLPPKVLETWPAVRRTFPLPLCGNCGEPGASDGTTCSSCKVNISGEVPWTPYAANKGC